MFPVVGPFSATATVDDDMGEGKRDGNGGVSEICRSLYAITCHISMDMKNSEHWNNHSRGEKIPNRDAYSIPNFPTRFSADLSTEGSDFTRSTYLLHEG